MRNLCFANPKALIRVAAWKTPPAHFCMFRYDQDQGKGMTKCLKCIPAVVPESWRKSSWHSLLLLLQDISEPKKLVQRNRKLGHFSHFTSNPSSSLLLVHAFLPSHGSVKESVLVLEVASLQPAIECVVNADPKVLCYSKQSEAWPPWQPLPLKSYR